MLRKILDGLFDEIGERHTATRAGIHLFEDLFETCFSTFFRVSLCLREGNRSQYHFTADAIHHSRFVQNGNGVLIGPREIIRVKEPVLAIHGKTSQDPCERRYP
ncbi:hypothetical protein D9M68_717700 [compost metagenome]